MKKVSLFFCAFLFCFSVQAEVFNPLSLEVINYGTPGEPPQPRVFADLEHPSGLGEMIEVKLVSGFNLDLVKLALSIEDKEPTIEIKGVRKPGEHFWGGYIETSELSLNGITLAPRPTVE